MKKRSRLSEAVEFRGFGECPVDIDKAILLWNSKCLISKSTVSKTEFVLMEYDQDRFGMNRRLCRYTISESDALQLIKRLNLQYFPGYNTEGYYAHVNPGIIYI